MYGKIIYMDTGKREKEKTEMQKRKYLFFNGERRKSDYCGTTGS